MLTISLSHLKKISTYLAAKKAELNTALVRQRIETLEAKLAECRARHSDAVAEYRSAWDVLQKTRQVPLAEHKAATDRLESLIQPESLRRWLFWAAEKETDRANLHYSADRAAAYAEYRRTAKLVAALPSEVETVKRDAIAAEVRQLEQQITACQSYIARMQTATKEAADRVSKDVLSLDEATLNKIAKLTIDELEIPSAPERPAPIAAGIIRNEIEDSCDCVRGYINVSVTVDATAIVLHLDDEVRHPLCHLRTQFDTRWLEGTLPPKHAAHRLATLGAWERSPISSEDQIQAMSLIPSTLEDLRGWLMLGPAGTSKTTYAAAAITDWLTFRMIHSLEAMKDEYDKRTPGERINYWRVKAPQWLREMEAYENRDFGDRSVVEPFLTVKKIEQVIEHCEWPPILWLEELDKFNPTTNRLRNLYLLVDAVYEAGGVIVSTTNQREQALEKLLGEAIYRRLSGKNDDPSEYVVIDYYELAESKKKNQQKKNKAIEKKKEDGNIH
jgi:hypothetical protein